MNLSETGKEVAACISIDEKKLANVVVEKVILHALQKVVKDTTNPFDDQAYAMLAPLVGPKIEEAVAELFGKAGL